MNEKDSLYRRDDDQKWRDRVNDRLASLTAGETVQDDRIDKLEDLADAIDQTVRGARDDSRDGLSSRLKEQERLMRELRMVVIGKYDGDPGGLVNAVNDVKENRPLKEKRLEIHWKYLWGPLIGLVLAGLGYQLYGNFPWLKARAAKFVAEYRKADPYKDLMKPPAKHSRRSGSKRKKAPKLSVPVEVPVLPPEAANEHKTDVSQ